MFTRQLGILALALGFATVLGACSSSSDELPAPTQKSDPTVENTNPSAADPLPSDGVPEAPRDPATNPADPTAPVNPADPANPAGATDPANPADPSNPAGGTADDPMGNPSL